MALIRFLVLIIMIVINQKPNVETFVGQKDI